MNPNKCPIFIQYNLGFNHRIDQIFFNFVVKLAHRDQNGLHLSTIP